MEKFIEQLKQRQVFKVATIYAVSAWPLIQIADLSVPALGLPDSVMTLLLKVFIAGFPITLVFAWIFNFTPDGIVRASEDTDDNGPQGGNVKATLAVVGSLLIVTTIILTSQLMIDHDLPTPNQPEATVASTSSPEMPEARGKSEFFELPQEDQKQSIAVLPFAAFSSDPEDEYFADGMVEELLNLLAKIPDLQVAARTSSFAYKGVQNKTIPEIGLELGVDTILEGSIRKNDTTNKIRITAQLIEVRTGDHLWSETYDRVYQDIFQIQDDIATAVVNKMKVTLLGDNQEIDIAAETLSIDAMVEHGKGQKELSHRSVASLNAALDHFNRATELDPNYARAFVGVADAHLLLGLYGNISSDKAQPLAKAAIDKALSIDDQFAPAFASQGLLLTNSSPQEAEASFKRAIELNPNYAITYTWYGSLLKGQGKLQASNEMFKKAFELDPKSPVAANNIAWGYYHEGDEEKAMEMFSQIITNDPFYPGAYNLAGEIMTNHGQLDEAAKMYIRALEVDPVNREAISGIILATMDVGDFDVTEKWFSYIEKNQQHFSKFDLNLMKARFYLVQSNRDEAMRYLELAEFGDPNSKSHIFFEGERAFYKENYELAVSQYTKLLQLDQSNEGFFYQIQNGEAVTHLVYSYLKNGNQAEANELIAKFEEYVRSTESRRSNDPYYYMNMAQIYALKGVEQEAFYYMQAAIDLGWVRTWEAVHSPIFEEMSKNTQFAQMIGGIQARLATMRIRMQKKESTLLADAE